MKTVRLIAVEDADFDWLLGEGDGRTGLRLAEGGVQHPATVAHIRQLTAPMLSAGFTGSWLIAAGDEVVGLCGYHAMPSQAGDVEIGYGIAASRRGRGYMKAAVAQIVTAARLDPTISRLIAETAAGNVASQAVLVANGFTRGATRIDPNEGELVAWTLCIVR